MSFSKIVILYPNFNAYYYSFYVNTLLKNYSGIKFSRKGFPDFHQHCLAFEINHFDKNYKIYISAGDGLGFNQLGLEWCDVYAKVNVDMCKLPDKYRNKILPIGPSFGINYLGGLQSLSQACITFLISKLKLENSQEHFANYYRQWKYRVPIAKYSIWNPCENYIFHASTLWRKEETTNIYRANFMEVVNENSSIIFEGGFAPGKDDISDRFNKLTLNFKYSGIEYLSNTKRSLVVFNTSAVQGCFGWKLGEYLALGKAIISTPLTNTLPSPLVHRKHIHIVNGSKKSISNAIEEIRLNHVYRQELENNSREYFLNYLSPDSVFSRILKFAEAK